MHLGKFTFQDDTLYCNIAIMEVRLNQPNYLKDFNKNSYVKSLEPNLKHIKSTDRSDDLHSNDSRFNIWTLHVKIQHTCPWHEL